MTVLVDTGVLYADHDTDASRHAVASEALEAIYDGSLGQPYLTDYVLDEALTLTRRRTGSFEAATQLADRLLGREDYPDVYELRYVTAETFADSLDVFEAYDDQRLSFTDASSIAVMDSESIDGILSFDDDFDGLVDRIDPADL